MSEGHIQVEQGLTEFSDEVARAHSCATLAGWALLLAGMRVWNGTGAVLKSQCLRCWGPAVGPPPQFLIHWHFLRDSTCLTHEDKDLEREFGVIYYLQKWISFVSLITSDETK